MKYLLDAPHFAEGQLFPAGTLVGDGTPFPWKNASGSYITPSLSVTAIDAGAKAALAARYSVTADGARPLKRR